MKLRNFSLLPPAGVIGGQEVCAVSWRLSHNVISNSNNGSRPFVGPIGIIFINHVPGQRTWERRPDSGVAPGPGPVGGGLADFFRRPFPIQKVSRNIRRSPAPDQRGDTIRRTRPEGDQVPAEDLHGSARDRDPRDLSTGRCGAEIR